MTIPYPRISPVLLHIGPIQIRWYGIMYLVGYVVGYRLLRQRIKRGLLAMSEPDLDALIGYFVVGMLVGARLVYAIVYQPGHYLNEPLEFFRLWHGGLSFHGAMLGMVAACLVFAHRRHVPFWQLGDALAYCGAPGLFFGRLGNFINGELYGRPSHLPWAMIFPSDPLHIPRHPSELYEALGEGVLVFLLLAVLQRRALKRDWYRPGLLAGAFLMLYGTVRFLLEFTRQPDPQLGLVVGPFSMGQVLCAGMVVAGVILMAVLYRGGRPEPPSAPESARSG
jgi:phosphatidylglycerol:prolipoprotein diacylglycerol transferase